MQREYLIQETQQLKAVSNPIRMQMLQLLIEQQLTATQIGAQMAIAPARAHYHLKQLESARLVQLVETRENAGILEKYYRAVSHRFRLDRTVMHDPSGAKNRISQLHTLIESTTRGLETRLEASDIHADTVDSELLFQVMTLRLTPQRYERMISRLRALLLEYTSDERPERLERPGVNDYKLMLMAYPDQEDGNGGA